MCSSGGNYASDNREFLQLPRYLFEFRAPVTQKNGTSCVTTPSNREVAWESIVVELLAAPQYTGFPRKGSRLGVGSRRRECKGHAAVTGIHFQRRKGVCTEGKIIACRHKQGALHRTVIATVTRLLRCVAPETVLGLCNHYRVSAPVDRSPERILKHESHD